MGRVYVVRLDATSVASAKSLIQVTAPSSMSLTLLRAWVGNDLSETSQQEVAEIIRKTATGTGTSFTPKALRTGDPAATFTSINDLTAEGTDGDKLIREPFNILNGWLYVPVPEERITVAPSGILALKLASVATAFTVSAGMVIEEN